MKAYIISILGITLCGVMIDVILPSGSTSKFIKSIYSIFVVAVIINPIITFFANKNNLQIKYDNIQINSNLVNYINVEKVKSVEISIEKELEERGAAHVDITLHFSYENNNFKYNSCVVDLKNLVYQPLDKHISKYELITEVVQQHTNLSDEVIIFNE